MLGFDFSSSEMEVWQTPIPNGCVGLVFESIAWMNGELRIVAEGSVELGRPAGVTNRQYTVTCRPLVAMTVFHEAMELSLWRRASELDLPKGAHLKIKNSDWVDSLKTYEGYGFDLQDGEACHYVLCSEVEVVHIISKDEPKFKMTKEWEDGHLSFAESISSIGTGTQNN